MTHDLLRPVLWVVIPADWDFVPEGVAALRRYLADECGASLLLRVAVEPLASPLLLYAGSWTPKTQGAAQRDVTAQLAQAFVDLKWLDTAPQAG